MHCCFFPSWGAYFWYHSWSEFRFAYKHPAAYVELQKDFGFWSFCWNMAHCAVTTTISSTVDSHSKAQSRQDQTRLRGICLLHLSLLVHHRPQPVCNPHNLCLSHRQWQGYVCRQRSRDQRVQVQHVLLAPRLPQHRRNCRPARRRAARQHLGVLNL